MKRSHSLFTAVVLLFFLGCRGNERPVVVPASGVVRLDGKPTEKLSVVFFPSTGRSAAGVTDAQGRFELTTFETGDGAVVGEHAVTITPMMDPPIYMPSDLSQPPRPSKRPRPPVPQKYISAATTDLKETVKSDAPNEFTFDVSSK